MLFQKKDKKREKKTDRHIGGNMVLAWMMKSGKCRIGTMVFHFFFLYLLLVCLLSFYFCIFSNSPNVHMSCINTFQAYILLSITFLFISSTSNQNTETISNYKHIFQIQSHSMNHLTLLFIRSFVHSFYIFYFLLLCCCDVFDFVFVFVLVFVFLPNTDTKYLFENAFVKCSFCLKCTHAQHIYW